MANVISFKEYAAGTSYVVGTAKEALSLSETAPAVVGVIGYVKDALVITDKTTGKLWLTGKTTEALLFSEGAVGVGSRKGMSSELLAFSESAKGIKYISGLAKEKMSFGESGQELNHAINSERLLFIEKTLGIVAEITDGIWVVNLVTGGHARYEGDISGALPVDAYVLTGVDQLGMDKAKHVYDAFAHIRTDEDFDITVITNEQRAPLSRRCYSDGKSGLHRRRIKLDKGPRGTNWQFKVSNVDGSMITVKSLEVVPIESQRFK